jgi:hypothetical protein
MAKTKVFKVDYKGLVREIRKTLKTLKKIEKKVAAKQKPAIALQIKSLDYLEGVCTSAAVGVSSQNVPPKMSGCKMVVAKMSKLYSGS